MSEIEENENKFEFYNEDEIRKIIKSKEDLYYMDNGFDEVIVRFKDIPDAIMDVNMKLGSSDLKFYKVGGYFDGPVIKTMGIYLDKIKPELREKMIDRLVQLQTGEKDIKKYKLIDEDQYDIVKDKIAKEIKQKKKSKGAR